LDASKIEEFIARRKIPNAKLYPPAKRPDARAWKKLNESPMFDISNQFLQKRVNYYSPRLGKTVQSTAFLNDLYQNQNFKGPFLIVTPLSTIGNWEREIKTWTNMNVVTYHGSDKVRNLIVNTEFYYKDERIAKKKYRGQA
ncbi:hypothetical protein HK096_011551, partial [Nowakowskiella sp. JEL0078]